MGGRSIGTAKYASGVQSRRNTGEHESEKGEKEKSPSPGQYETHKAFLRTSTIDNSIQWSIPKAEKLMFTDYSIKAAKNKPSVGNYELAKADGKVTIGARGKPGYYK